MVIGDNGDDNGSDNGGGGNGSDGDDMLMEMPVAGFGQEKMCSASQWTHCLTSELLSKVMSS